MLTRIEIQNFQSHKHTKLSLHKGFNIITGPSGSGKSAFLRALNALFYNNMQGTSFIRIDPTDKPEAYSVAAWPSGTGSLVRKIRGDKNNQNCYIIVPEADMDGQAVYMTNRTMGQVDRFDNVKTDVPDRVQELLNIYPIKIDSNKEINIQYCGQFDSPFMLMEPDATKMKFLNTISGTYAVDLAIKESNLRYQKAKKAYEAASLKIDQLTLESKTLGEKIDTLETANKYISDRAREVAELTEEGKKLRELQKVTNELTAKFKQVLAVETLVNRVNLTTLAEKVEKIKKFFDLEQKYAEILSKYRSVKEQLAVLDASDFPLLSKKIEEFERLVPILTKYEELMKKHKNLQHKIAPFYKFMIDTLADKVVTFETYLNMKQDYDFLVSSLNNIKKQHDEAQKKLDNDTKSYVKLVSDMGVCPVCNSPINGDVLGHIKEML